MLTIINHNQISSISWEDTALPGVKDIAAKVQNDLIAAATVPPQLHRQKDQCPDVCSIFVATIGCSEKLVEWETEDAVDLTSIRGKRECYGWFQRENQLIIAGSDKRGTIYGLFQLSEVLGVTPMTHWTGMEPPRYESFAIADTYLGCSKEPSVEYRGFFINDEWPAFGTWATNRFGGINAKLYTEVFELLLRMKGNYLWPAMWASCFACDGPGLEAAVIADRWGVVMGTSHHEPCLRHGEEYSHVRGPESIYGNAWNFRSNREGITRFWRDGLQRNGHLENVITIGMRGERDSSIMGNATLADNIDLLKDVITTQNQLISEIVNPDLKQVPRMLALYKEVEPYYYGDAETAGLKNWSGIDDVTLLLCDDNHGYVRTLPDDSMRSHPGGFGMYYHFDYHGDPISYEWVNSTELNEVRYEMSLCWDYGIRKMWIVNVGDLCLQEHPLNFFMDLAYDYPGTMELTKRGTEAWTERWTDRNFGHVVEPQVCKDISNVILSYTRMNHNRRPEHLNEKSYHPVHGGIAERTWNTADKIEATILRLGDEMKRNSDQLYGAFVELVGYNAIASAHLHRLWIGTTWNHYYAERGLIIANIHAERAQLNLHRDQLITEELHRVAGGRWNGVGLAKHIGFTRWNSEERQYPLLYQVYESGDPMLVVGSVQDEQWTQGGEWTGKPVHIYAEEVLSEDDEPFLCWKFYVATTSSRDTEYEIWVETKTGSAAGLLIDGSRGRTGGLLTTWNRYQVITVTLPREYGRGEDSENIVLAVKGPEGTARVVLHDEPLAWYCTEASCYTSVSSKDHITIHQGLGREGDGLSFTEYEDSWIEYETEILNPCTEGNVYIMMLPANPFTSGGNIRMKWQINDGPVQEENLLPDDYTVGHSPEWAEGVILHVRPFVIKTAMKCGMNKIRIYGTCPELVLEQVAFQPQVAWTTE